MSAAEKTKAQLVIVTGMLVLYFIFKARYPWFLYIGAGVGVISLAVPVLGDLIVKGWYKLAEILGAINGRILLSIIFFIFLTPIALLSRLFVKKNPLALKKQESGGSAFTERNHLYTAKDMENVW